MENNTENNTENNMGNNNKTIIINKKTTPVDFEKLTWVCKGVSTDKTRESIHGVYSVDGRIYSTDGYHLRSCIVDSIIPDGYYDFILSKSDIVFTVSSKNGMNLPDIKRVVPHKENKIDVFEIMANSITGKSALLAEIYKHSLFDYELIFKSIPPESSYKKTTVYVFKSNVLIECGDSFSIVMPLRIPSAPIVERTQQ